ncbi:hypothetical protein, partial [Bacteroides uniformis]
IAIAIAIARAIAIAIARVYTKKLSYLFFHTSTSSMDFIASSVQGIISITPKIEIIGTANVNLQSLGRFVPSTANWLIDAAPYQHHNLRQSVNVTSLPFFSFNVPKNTPALSARIITFFPIIILYI